MDRLRLEGWTFLLRYEPGQNPNAIFYKGEERYGAWGDCAGLAICYAALICRYNQEPQGEA